MISDHALHLVFGPPASGKTTYARELARQLGACLLDNDEVTERLVRTGLNLAGWNPDDRDSDAYKNVYRDAVYETLFDLAVSNLKSVPVVMTGPFTREGGDEDWPHRLEERLGVLPEFHFVWCPADVRKERIEQRGEERDRPKLADWENYAKTCRDEPPVFPHRWIVTG